MKQAKRILALLLVFVLALSMSLVSFAKKKDDDDDEQDYSVTDVYFDVSDSAIYICWTVGDSECSYTVQLYDNKDMKAKNKVGNNITVKYSAEQVDVTQRILNNGSGTYYAEVKANKKPKGGSYSKAIGKETIYSEDISTIKKNLKANKAAEKESGASSKETGAANPGQAGPGAAGPGETAASSAASSSAAADSSTPVESGQWIALADGKWAYEYSNGVRATGWYEAGGKWYYSGEDGVMYAASWIESAAIPGVWYYVDESGAMLTDTERDIEVDGVPVHYQFDGTGAAQRI